MYLSFNSLSLCEAAANILQKSDDINERLEKTSRGAFKLRDNFLKEATWLQPAELAATLKEQSAAFCEIAEVPFASLAEQARWTALPIIEQ